MNKTGWFFVRVYLGALCVFIPAMIGIHSWKTEDRRVLGVMNLSCERIDETELRGATYRIFKCGEEHKIVELHTN